MPWHSPDLQFGVNAVCGKDAQLAHLLHTIPHVAQHCRHVTRGMHQCTHQHVPGTDIPPASESPDLCYVVQRLCGFLSWT
jgi:hypothetical protein